ncbi:OstA-like protein [Pedobacter sp. AW31-3R]|uniref:OstA-like protein n=1 Tax=Pedobacter sp. AW31-3R TaxID=3445781 RepID=UPI003F9FB560
MQKLHIFHKMNPQSHITVATVVPQSIPSPLLLVFSLCLFLFSLPNSVSAQKKTKIILQGSDKSRTLVKEDITYLRKPIFRQDNAILTCDSAVFYSAKNYFEAYDNVHINQADTINIYSDRLTYDGNAKLAHLTSNVRLQDKTSTLTTNTLDYNMGPKVGTYVDGGKIVNKDATITSKNGYYFANSRDAYFRYNVLVVTEQSTIKSDTLRYNTFSNWAYFYGPTNIKEKDGNLYTENGAYNTKTTYAYFGKKNLYTSGSRSLKGDSLYYDGIAGYGKAVRNIVFRDTVDKMLMRGQLGYYYKKDQRTLVTKNAYAGLGTTDSILVDGVKQPDSLWLGADTLETQMVLQKSLTLLRGPVIKADNELGEEKRDASVGLGKEKTPKPGNTGGPKNGRPADTPLNKANGQAKRNPADDKKKNKADNKLSVDEPAILPPWIKESSIKPDSITLADTLAKLDSLHALAKDSLKIKQGTTNAKATAQKGKGTPVKAVPDSLKGKTQLKPIAKGGQKSTAKDSLPLNPADTILTRIIKAYHHVQVYKSNMQAKSDSLFYTSADSTLRWYVNPIMWAQNSQQTGDTIYLQLRNKKVNSVQVIRNAFAVNVEKDSAKFNQVKGKMMTGFFKEGKLDLMYVDGNAESVYYTKTDDGKKYDKMNQTISSRIKVTFRNSDISEVMTIKDAEGLSKPVAEMKEDVLLTGFIWKPELRPLSKRDITHPKSSAAAKKPAAKTGKKPATAKAGAVKAAAGKAAPIKSAVPKIPLSAKDLSDPSGLGKKLKSTTDSLIKSGVNPVDSIPAEIQDAAKKAIPGVLQKVDSLTKQPVILKKQ